MNVTPQILQLVDIKMFWRTFFSFKTVYGFTDFPYQIQNYKSLRGHLNFCCPLCVRVRLLHFMSFGGQKLKINSSITFFDYKFMLPFLWRNTC